MAILEPREFISKKGRKFTFRSLDSNEGAEFNQFMQQIANETQNTYQVPGRMPFTDQEQGERQKKMSESFTDLNISVFEKNQLIGCLGFFVHTPNHPWSKHTGQFGMMILQHAWGEGLGKELLRLADEHARAVGITRIEATVRTFNDRGVSLYKNAGYKIEGTRRNAAFIDGKMTDEYSIAKLLDEKFPKWTPPTLETKRLILRAITPDDAPAIFRYASNPNVAKWSLWEAHQTIQDSIAMIRDYVIPTYDQMTPEPFGIALKSDPAIIIGTCGARWESKKSQCMELAAALAEEHWGKGIMTEAQNEVIRYCFEEFSTTVSPVNRIQGHCKSENMRSESMILKTGRLYEGTHRQRMFNKNKFSDMKSFALLKEDWLKTRKSS